MKATNILICLLRSVFLSILSAEPENLAAKIQKIQNELPEWMQKAESGNMVLSG